MSIEVIPEPYRAPFDPLTAVDHDLVRLYTHCRLTSGRGVRNELQQVFSTNRFHSRELIERLINYGRFLEPYDDDLGVVDETYMRTRVFNAGFSLALAATANLAFELDIDQFEWRCAWIGLPKNIDAPLDIRIDATSTPDDCFKIGAAIMDIGQRNLANIEEPYRQLVNDIDDSYVSDGIHSNIFQASFGYTFGIGRRILHDLTVDSAIETIIAREFPDADDSSVYGPFNDEYKRMLFKEAN